MFITEDYLVHSYYGQAIYLGFMTIEEAREKLKKKTAEIQLKEDRELAERLCKIWFPKENWDKFSEEEKEACIKSQMGSFPAAQEANIPTLTGEYAEQLQEDKEIKTYKLSDYDQLDLFDHLRLLAQQFIANKETKTLIKESELKDGVRIKTIFTRGKKNV